MSSDESDNDAENNYGDVIFHSMSPNDLVVDSVILDDLYTGVSSKIRWRRRPDYLFKRFLWTSECNWYLNNCVVPYLNNLLSSGNNFFVWIATRIEFEKINDPSDETTRLDSV